MLSLTLRHTFVGIQDAHNLIWKLALVLSGREKDTRKVVSLLESYDKERRPVAIANTTLSLANYEKSSKAASILGLDPGDALCKEVVTLILIHPNTDSEYFNLHFNL